MKLYTVPVSPNCRRVEATALFLGLDVEIVTANISNGDLKSSDFLKLNPNGKVPLLIDGETVLWESNAIMQYLADQGPAPEFFPPDPLVRADVVRWQFWESLHFNKAVGGICWETLAKPAMGLGDPDEAIIEKSTQDFRQFAKVLNDRLEGGAFIMGDKPTLADFSVGNHSGLVLAPQSRVPLGEFPNVRTWYLSLEAVPAWAQTASSF